VKNQVSDPIGDAVSRALDDLANPGYSQDLAAMYAGIGVELTVGGQAAAVPAAEDATGERANQDSEAKKAQEQKEITAKALHENTVRKQNLLKNWARSHGILGWRPSSGKPR
jgi:hypothetical protein